MQSLKNMLFENPMTLYIGLGMVVIVLLAIWYRQLTARRLLILAAVLLVGVGIFAIERMVVTDRETIAAALDELAASAAIRPTSSEALEKYLDDEVRLDLGPIIGGTNVDKDRALEIWRATINSRKIKRIAIHSPDITIDGHIATTRFATVLTYSTGSANDTAPSEAKDSWIWDLEWALRDGQWRIVLVSPPSRGLKP